MFELLRQPVTQSIVLFAAVIGIISLGILIVAKLRDQVVHNEDAGRDEPESSDLLSNFREMHAKGALSDEEFRRIKTKLGGELQQELSDSDKTG